MFDFFKKIDIGVDLGTANILIFVKGRGIVLNEPSVVAKDRDTNKVLAIGKEARDMLGRTPGNIIAVRPLREGVIADYDTTEAMLRYFIQKVVKKSTFFKPRIMICVPAGVTGVEKRSVLEAAMQAGSSKTYLVEEPLAAALGAGLDISEPAGSMVIDIGGGTTDIAVMSLGGIVVCDSIRIGGDKFDDAIIRYVKKEFNVLIGERTAEEIKINVATAHLETRNVTAEVRGRDLVMGLPKTIVISSEQTREALLEAIDAIVLRVKHVLEQTPPELSSDVMDRGIVMTGGGAMLSGLDRVIQEATGVSTYIAEEPLKCVALGTGLALTNIEKLKEYIVTR